ncbi:50S ribosomal protein L14e [archaeon]|nr:50S ribosomal protein L14e [archaeon]
MIYEIGRIVLKTKGRDSNKPAVVVDIIDDNYVLIDGFVRRKKCNIAHLEPLDKTVKVKKTDKTESIKKILTKEGFKVKEKIIKKSPRKPKEEKKEKKPKKEKKEKKKTTKKSKK